MNLKESGCEGVDLIELNEDGVQWRAFWKTLMSLRVS